jgi:uncharacterized membrane protein YkvA (DUF1232 family)
MFGDKLVKGKIFKWYQNLPKVTQILVGFVAVLYVLWPADFMSAIPFGPLAIVDDLIVAFLSGLAIAGLEKLHHGIRARKSATR